MPFTYNTAYSAPSPASLPPASPSPLSDSTPIHHSRELPFIPDYSAPPSPEPEPAPVDADANIVLGDLVRSGEASRLRRRGAVRLDHTRAQSQSQSHSVSISSSSTIHPSRFYGSSSSHGRHARSGSVTLDDFGLRDPDGDQLEVDAYEHVEHGDEPTWAWPGAAASGSTTRTGSGRSLSGGALVQDELAAVADAQASTSRYTLFCGAPLNLPGRTYAPPPFAWAQLQPVSAPLTSGCGALVHAHALPRKSADAYSARCAAAPVVVPLEAEYAHPELAQRAVRSSCGCVRQVIGCSACGNALGTRYVPCRAAANGLFSASACCKPRVQPRPKSGDGDDAEETHAEEYMYTFDASAVHAAPAPPLPLPLARPTPAPAPSPPTPASELTPLISSAPRHPPRVRRISVQVTTETVQTGSSSAPASALGALSSQAQADDIVYTLLGPRVLFSASPESETPPPLPLPASVSRSRSASPRSYASAMLDMYLERAGSRSGGAEEAMEGGEEEEDGEEGEGEVEGETDGDKTPGPTESVLPVSWTSR